MDDNPQRADRITEMARQVISGEAKLIDITDWSDEEAERFVISSRDVAATSEAET